jgi:hypothetical protein
VPELMKAAVVHALGAPLTIEDAPAPMQQPSEVLMQSIPPGTPEDHSQLLELAEDALRFRR